jgi:hypothetical protein
MGNNLHKIDLMNLVVSEKFEQNQNLLDLLLKTGESFLSEGNNHHDNFFGSCQCKKCYNKVKFNHLGEILMKIRKEFS